MTQKSEIEWQKFYDPFEDLDEEMNHDTQLTEEYNDSYEDHQSLLSLQANQLRKNYPFILTPQGPLPLTENNKPSVVWNLWILHTNVELTEDLKNKIKLIPGVELLNVLTRYRVLVSLGKIFDSAKVKVDIEAVIHDHVKDIDISVDEVSSLGPSALSLESFDVAEAIVEDIRIMKDTLSKQAKYWIICVLPNNSMDVITSDSKNDEDFKDKLMIYNETVRNFGGQVITSWDV